MEEQTARLLIVGDGSEREKLEQQVHNRDLADVEIRGYREDIPNLMAAADIFVLPSYREGTPRVITEALASGLPVVSTAIAGIPEQVADGKTGFLISPGDTVALTNNLRQLCLNPELRDQMSRRAQTTVDKFSLSEAQESYGRLYSKLGNEIK